ncbi:FAD-dependent oxidoreductase [Actinorhabdospora filicis]|uniref:FAD-dependent oxidoreductase n=1 Tax=Actinorhabdospora filicis TaxID=1785913 RepID=A0A9W6SHN6_9ACTN|nr:FAD-dependent monooxygenase [Actinorhabdospora filicis]GLZ76168.1 FAD-dependent oxidoreductase [Actinorhabdospora filicis]
MTDILISGASIAGLSLAHWLRRHGFAVTVVERAPAPRPGGHAVDLRGASREVAERMGVTEAILAARVHERGLAYVDARDRVTATMPAEALGGEGAVAEIEILRGDLTDILYRAAGPVEYLFGDSIAHLTQDASGVSVIFERSGSRRFDLVIGADGLHSNVRKLVFGPEDRFVHHLGAYMAYFTIGTRLDLDGWFRMHSIPGRKMAAIRPEAPGRAKAMFAFAAKRLDYDRRDQEAQRAILRERFAGSGWHVPDLLRALPDSPDFFFDEVAQVRMDTWTSGRVTLLGDAAYCGSPLSGNGTAMAMVGAYLLAGELAAARGDHRVAFASYENLMGPYAAECRKLPPGGVNGFLPKGRAAMWMRDRVISMMTSRALKKPAEKTARKADRVELPEYRVPAGR